MEITIASNAAESEAVEKVVTHHQAMAGQLRVLIDTLLSASGGTGELAVARDRTVDWCRRELVPHALAEEHHFYPATHKLAPQLIDAMTSEHLVLTTLIGELSTQTRPERLAATAGALLAVFDSHVDKENSIMLPLLAGDPGSSVVDLLDAMHADLASQTPAAPADDHSHDCNCGEADEPDFPVLDARVVPHAIRHATVFGALDAVRVGKGLILVAPHDPLPLLAQLERRSPETFTVSYLERGPEEWRLAIVRSEVA